MPDDFRVGATIARILAEMRESGRMTYGSYDPRALLPCQECHSLARRTLDLFSNVTYVVYGRPFKARPRGVVLTDDLDLTDCDWLGRSVVTTPTGARRWTAVACVHVPRVERLVGTAAFGLSRAFVATFSAMHAQDGPTRFVFGGRSEVHVNDWALVEDVLGLLVANDARRSEEKGRGEDTMRLKDLPVPEGWMLSELGTEGITPQALASWALSSSRDGSNR